MISADSNLPVPITYSGVTAGGWEPSPEVQAPTQSEPGFPWRRSLAALGRYKWLIACVTVAGVAAGVAGSRFIRPEYEAHATIWISNESTQDSRTGPIRSEELLTARSWPELLRSFAILEKVVRYQSLFLSPEDPADSLVFAGFGLEDRVRPGNYVLRVRAPGRYVLVTDKRQALDSGAVGDSIGRSLGFLWAPRPEHLAAGRSVAFGITTPRAAAVALEKRISTDLQDRSNLLQVTHRGSDPVAVAATLNTLADEFIKTAADLKTRSLAEMTVALREQLDYAYAELKSAEIALENFRVNTITKPSEGSAVAGGIEITRDPVFASFFEQRIELDNTRRDRESLERAMNAAQGDDGSFNSLWAIPAVQTYGQELRTALTEYAAKDAALRALRTRYTDENPDVREAARQAQALQAQVIPSLAAALVAQLRERERDLESRIGNASRELREIPSRTIEELRLRRNVAVRDNLYSMLRTRFEEARLSETSSLPDVSVLDRAAAPTEPRRNTAPQLILIALVGSLGAGILIALALDRVDRRFRYPDQATDELGLAILGAVPALKNGSASGDNVEEAAQAVEAFRTIRLTLTHTLRGSRALQVAVSSPGIGDGKSLVSANLALSFAEAGYPTLLIDGDIRRGQLHTTFGVERRPGFVDALTGAVSIEEVLRPTTHPQLRLIPAGTRSRHGPELLTSRTLPAVLDTLATRFQVIIIDTPPLGAGIDPFALGSAAHNLVLVLRSGTSDRKMAQAKLEILDRLPVRVLGAILNAIETKGVYEYYSYLDQYAAKDELLEPELVPHRLER